MAFPKIYSHKAVHNFIQEEFYKTGDTLGGPDCGGEERIDNQASWDFSYENIKAAFDAGADYVEVDTRLTKDGVPILFHDQKLDCLTNLSGNVSDYTYEYLLKNMSANHRVYFKGDKRDLKNRPFYNKGIGEILSLEKLLKLFPSKKFLLNPKDKSREEIDAYRETLKKFPNSKVDIWGPRRTYDELKKVNISALKDFISNHWQSEKCLVAYNKYYKWFGWLGYFPSECENTTLSVSQNVVGKIYGWPKEFVDLMRSRKTKVYFYLPKMLPKSTLKNIMESEIEGIIVTDIKSFQKMFLKQKVK